MAKREDEARSTDRSEEEAKRKPLANRESPRSQDEGRLGHQGREAGPVTTGCGRCRAPGCLAGGSASAAAPGSSSSTATGAIGERSRRQTVLTSRDGTSFTEAVGTGASSEAAPVVQQYSETRMTKLISTGGPTLICYQLYMEGNVATWKQVSIPNYGHQGVLLMPVKRMPHPDQVDPAAMAWQTAPASTRRVGTTEVVMRGVSQEPDGRRRELILFTDRATGRQTVRFRFQTGVEALTARNEGLTLYAPRMGGAAGEEEQLAGAGQGSEAEKDKAPRRENRPK